MGERHLPVPETPWHQNEHGCWSMSLGVRGMKVRIEQRKRGSVFHRVYRLPSGRYTYKSLKTIDRRLARELAITFVRELEKGNRPSPRDPLTLETLWNKYQLEAPGYRQNTEATRKDKAAAARLLMLAFGPKKQVDRFTRNDIDRFIAMRETGLGWPDGRTTKPIRARTVAGEVKLLKTMINWAMNERLPDGSWLLEADPVRKIKLPREEDPRRPVATYDRFLKLKKAAEELAAAAPQQRGTERWNRWIMALVLAEATGARIGAIRGLRWSDVDFGSGEITFRAEFDKRGRDRTIPMPAALAKELRRFRVELKAIGDGWLFPRAESDAPWPREIFAQLYERAERHAKLDHQPGGKFHALRRKWATERKGMAPADVMAVGGWKDFQTYLNSYAKSTEEGRVEVMNQPAKLRDHKARLLEGTEGHD
jgi:integrase